MASLLLHLCTYCEFVLRACDARFWLRVRRPSVVYDSDAVAGVVSFIMKKDFEDLEVTSLHSTYWHKNSFGGPDEGKLRDFIAERAASARCRRRRELAWQPLGPRRGR